MYSELNFKTLDGKSFKTLENAKKHAQNCYCNKLTEISCTLANEIKGREQNHIIIGSWIDKNISQFNILNELLNDINFDEEV